MRTILIALFLHSVSSPTFAADVIDVVAFEYRSGLTGERVRITGGDQLIDNSRASEILREAGEEFDHIIIHCNANPGPRYAQIDGAFFALNGNAKRAGAMAVSSDGQQFPILDTHHKTSPLRHHPEAVQILIDDAKWVC